MTLPAPLPAHRYTPFPIDTDRRREEFDLAVKISSPTGWYDLEDGLHYAIHGDSFASFQQTWRKTEINSPWIEGSYPVNAVRENVTEQLAVWVSGETAREEREYRDKLIATIEQYSYMLMVRFGDVAEYWNCFASDYSVETQKEFLWAQLSVVRANVTRLPAKQVVDVTQDVM